MSAPARAATRTAAALLALAVPARAGVVEGIVAVVNDDVILLSELEERAAALAAEEGRDRQRAQTLRRIVLDRLIDEQLVLQAARELRIQIPAEEVDRAIAEIKKQNDLSDAQLGEALQAQGLSMARYRQDIRHQLTRFRAVQAAVGSRVAVSDEDVRRYYDEHVRKAGREEQVRVSHILVSIPEGGTAAEAGERQAFAADLARRAREGADFAALAREHSDDAATRADGGDLGYFRRGLLPKALEEAVFGLAVGQVAGPVRTANGYHVLRLTDRKVSEVKSLAEMREDLRLKLRQMELDKATRQWLQELRRKAHIDVRL